MHLDFIPTASARALALPEIVTSIMYHMDMRTLITSQRVCRTWANLIQTSRSLQESLFFIPVHASNDASKPRIYNSLLAETFPSFFPSDVDNDAIRRTTLSTLPFIKRSQTLKAHLRPEASWRRMFTAQPPVHIIGRYTCSSRIMGQTWHQQKVAPQKEGLRIGTLFDLTIQIRRHEWNNYELWISLGEEAPVNAPTKMKQPSIDVDVDRIDLDSEIMLSETDLVLLTGGHEDCTDSVGPEDPDWVKSEDEIIWEKICNCYEELGVRMADLSMEEFNGGWAALNQDV
ncbi:hypothetical protein F1880_007309 [Penicillium rolfsii]|nr:hypothetical protein F1880_007309 [Penicillium rolfsii]